MSSQRLKPSQVLRSSHSSPSWKQPELHTSLLHPMRAAAATALGEVAPEGHEASMAALANAVAEDKVWNVRWDSAP
eukprot:5845370-Amphidinium_carterae.1